MVSIRRLLRAAFVVGVMTAAVVAAAQDDIGIVRLTRSIAAQEQLNADLRTAVPRVQREARGEGDELGRLERSQDDTPITMASLLEARFAADTSRTRMITTESRIRTLAEEVERLDAELAGTDEDRASLSGTLDDYVAATRSNLLRRLRDLKTEALGLYREAAVQWPRRVALLDERVAFLEARIRLGTIDERKALAGDPRALAIGDFIARAGGLSVRLGNQAAEIDPRTPSERARKRVLELQADEALLRSNLRSADLDLLGIERQLDYLEAVARESGAPAQLAAEGINAAAAVRDRLENRRAGLADVRRRVEDQHELLASAPSENTASMAALVEGVAAMAGSQQRAIDALERRREQVAAAFAGLQAKAAGSTLLKHSPLPVGRAGWTRAAALATSLPLQLTAEVRGAVHAVRSRAVAAGFGRILAAAGASVGILLAIGLIRLALLRWIIRPQPHGTLAMVAAAIRESIFTLAPAAIWWAVALIIALPAAPALLVGGLLAIWPAVAFALCLARRILFSDGRTELETRRRLYRTLRWTTMLSGVLAALVIMTSTLPLAPALATLVDRGTMICVLLIALPGLRLRPLVLGISSEEPGPGLARRTAAAFSLLIPLLLAGAAAVGLAGYLNLAWAILGHIFWLAVVVGLLLLALGMLAEFGYERRRLAAERDPETGEFWKANFIDPIVRTGQLGLTLAAAWLLLRIFGWSSETPLIRELLTAARAPLLTLGQSTLTLQNIGMAVILGALAFWVGGWSQQVSYNLVLSRIRDIGIRRSLSAIVQYLVILLGLMLALKAIGLDLTVLTVFAASIGVAIGFGAQSLVKDIISGMFFVLDDAFRVGEYIESGSIRGTVEGFSLRSVKLRHHRGHLHTVPFGSLEKITNFSRDWVIDKVTLGLTYDTDLDKVKRIIKQIGRELLADPELAPHIIDTLKMQGVEEYGDFAVKIRLKLTCKPGEQFVIRRRAYGMIKKAFDENGIKFAFPTVQVAGGETSPAVAQTVLDTLPKPAA